MRAAAALVVALALSGVGAPARAAGGDLDLAAEFARICFASGDTLDARADALVARGADADAPGSASDTRMFALEIEGKLLVVLLDDTACVVSSSFVDIEATRRAFPDVVRAHARGEATRLEDKTRLGGLDNGEFLDAFTAGGGADEWVLMTGRSYDGRTLLTMGLRIGDPSAPPEPVR